MRCSVAAMTRARNHVGALAALAALLAACAAGSSQWHDRLTLLPASRDRILGERLIDAQYVVAGRGRQNERAGPDLTRRGGESKGPPSQGGPPPPYRPTLHRRPLLWGGGRPRPPALPVVA